MRARPSILLSVLLGAGCVRMTNGNTALVTAAADPASSCATAVPGSTVREEDSPRGAALVLTGPSASIEELRRRAALIVDLHSARREAYRTGVLAGRAGPLLRASASWEPAARGARVYFHAGSRGDVAHVRRAVSRAAYEMRDAGCPVLDPEARPVAGGGPASPSPSR